MHQTPPRHGHSTARHDQRDQENHASSSVLLDTAFELNFDDPTCPTTNHTGASSSINGLANESASTTGTGTITCGVLLRGRSNSCGPSSGYTRTRLNQSSLERPVAVSAPRIPLTTPSFVSPRHPSQQYNQLPNYYLQQNHQLAHQTNNSQPNNVHQPQPNGTLVMHWHGERPSSRERNAFEHEAQKEKEKTELVQMILEAIANVPVAVERIHTNQKLCAALREEIGDANPLLDQLFDRRIKKAESDTNLATKSLTSSSMVCTNSASADCNKITRGIASGGTPSPKQHGMFLSPMGNGTIMPPMAPRVPSPSCYSTPEVQARSEQKEKVDEDPSLGNGEQEDGEEEQEEGIEIDMLANSLAQTRGQVVTQGSEMRETETDVEQKESEAQRESSDFGSEYENDLAEAVNQLCMSPESFSMLEKRTSSPITIQHDLLTSASFRLMSTSHSPQSSLCFGMSPGTSSQDGEPVSALWPRQPHQFAFTQEEEEEEETRQEDEVYSEVVASEEEDMEKVVFDMDEEHEHDAFAAFEEEAGQHEHGQGDESPHGREDVLGADRCESDEDRIEEEEEAVDRDENEYDCGDQGDDEEEGDDEEDDEEEEEDDDDDDDDMGSKEYDVMTLRILREKNRTGFEPSQEFKPRIGSVVGNRYRVELAIGEAVFSRTYKCTDLEINKLVCLKIIKNNKEYFDQGIDEIRVMQFIASHGDLEANHLLRLLDYFYFREHLIIVTELLRDNLYEFSKLASERSISTYFTMPRVKKIAVEVLEALAFLHSLGIVHCDLKPENILISNFTQCRVKVIDFGSACFVTDELTSYVQSRSYRAPEVILGLSYNEKIDIWSLGCILAELITGDVLFQSNSEQSLLARINSVVGPIPSHLLHGDHTVDDSRKWLLLSSSSWQQQAQAQAHDRHHHQQQQQQPPRERLQEIVACDDAEFFDFLALLLQIDPAQRPTASQALQHPFCNPTLVTFHGYVSVMSDI